MWVYCTLKASRQATAPVAHIASKYVAVECMLLVACLVVVRRDTAGCDEDRRAKPAHDAMDL